MSDAATQGAHHIGLTVSRLEDSAGFFTTLLGWHEVRRDPDYPAIFVSDGAVLLTLWATRGADGARGFDKDRNVGLHHLALRVASRDALEAAHARLSDAGVEIEFAPEPLRGGPAMHMMCYEPSGIRVELIWPGA
jgi:catechol 2,3-dioxygenase-like lactoylglutathione lyase family enzyme